MLNKNLENALNKQINAEFWSAYLYLSMSTHFASEGLNGAANWFKIQFKEEQDHALKIIDYVISREGRVELAPIDKVSTKWESLLAAFLDTLEHEKVVTARIHEIVGIAREEKDFATENMLQWFVNEQVEEEETAQKIIDALKLIGNNGIGIYLIDKELGKRT
ncbi:MAG: ferritin [Bacteroidales bacterium]|nr:ferritin [Bacteroidales bacterium]